MQWCENVCRMCGRISETCHVLYHKDGLPSSLENKIKKCLNLNPRKDDYKPKQICTNCVAKLNDFCQFIDTCYANNQKFESIYADSQKWPRNYDYSLPKQSVIVSSKQTPDNLDFELYKNTGIVLENLNITNCQLNDAEMLNLVGNGDYNATNCTNELNIHGQFNCVLRHPPDSRVYHLKCSPEIVQENRSVSVDAAQKSSTHMAKVSSTDKKSRRRFPCPHCDRTFVRRGTLNAHVPKHTNIRPYKCDECCKSFGVKSGLTTHKKSHSDKHKCSFCFKKFSVPSKLQRHVRIHTNHKPYVCTYVGCNKAFSDKRNLVGHKLLHVSDKKFPCPICGKMFKTAGRLKQHAKCHSAGLMYACDLCAKKYKYKSNLASHVKKHNAMSCPYCRKNYSSNAQLVQHKKICKVRN